MLVADFGIGKAISDTTSDTLTQVGMSVGTPAYMSPEQAVGEDVDGRSDLYSLGCVLYEMLVGEPSFTGPTMQAVIAKRFGQTPLEVAALREGVPGPVSRAVQQSLARVAMDRRETAAHFAAALGERETIAAKPGAPPKSLVEIGEKLTVATVLQGSVRKAGRRMRIAVQLVSVSDGYHVRSERFDDLTVVFAMQDENAQAIAATLQVTFVSPPQQVKRPRRPR